jgi:uncharacterized protein YjiS (DUF1127 family)
MSSLSNGASRRVPATLRLSNSRQVDLGRPDLRWRQARSPLGRVLLWAFMAAAQPLVLWQKRIRDRDYLQRLPDYLLSDMGLDPHDVREEARKPFWRP